MKKIIDEEWGKKLIEEYTSTNINIADLAKKNGIGNSVLCRFFKRSGINTRNKRHIAEQNSESIINSYLSGKSCEEIGKLFGVSNSAVLRILHKNNIELRKHWHEDEYVKNQIIELYLSGISTTQLAKQFKTDRHWISEVIKSQGVDVVNKWNETKFNENIFNHIDTEEKAYWLGFIYADGNITKIVPDRKPHYTFEMSLKEEDKEHLDKFNKFMEFKGDNVKKKIIKLEGKEYIAYRWMITNKHLWETLNSYGCVPNKSLILKFPNESIFTDKSLIRHFIRGYFDGDGCITYTDKTHTKPLISVLGTEDVCNSIQNFIFNEELKLFLNSPKNPITKVMSRAGAKAMFFIFALYYKANIYLERKYQKVLEFKNCRFRAKALKLLEDKIGEGWDANPELIADLNDLQQCNA